MDRNRIVDISNSYYNNKLHINDILNILTRYCLEKGKTVQETTQVTQFLTQPNIFAALGHVAFEHALSYYQAKFKVCLVSKKADLNSYINPEYINKSYLLAY